MVRACAASDTPVHPPDTETLNVQTVWEQPVPRPSAAAGMHRIALSVPTGRGAFGGGGRAAVSVPAPKDACTPPTGTPDPSTLNGRGNRGRGGRAGLQPGQYTVRLTVDGQTYTQPVTIKPDPRGASNGIESTKRLLH